MKRKIVTLTMLSVLCFTGLTACGKSEAQKSVTEMPAVEEEKAAETVEKEEDETKETAETTAGEQDGDLLDTTLWSVNYDSSVWSYEEEDLNDSDTSSSVMLRIPDGEDTLVSVEIKAEVGEPYGFRDKLYDYGFDEYEYAENNAYDREDIGGIEFVTKESTYYGDDCIYYLARVENANESAFVTVTGDTSDTNVASLLNGITFKVTDIGNEDGPWYWEGEPYKVDDMSATVGSFTIEAHQLLMNEADLIHDIFAPRIAKVGDTVYVLNKDEIKAYDFDGTALTYNTSYTLDHEYKEMEATPNGTLILSNFMDPLIEWKDGSIVNDYSSLDANYVALHPSGTWGVSYFSGPECAKITLNGDGTGSEADLTFSELKTIQHLNVTDNYIFVCGSPAEGEGGHQVFVYNFDGSLVMTLTKEGESIGLGSCTYVDETENGFCAMDGNMREVVFWDKNGDLIGSLEDSDLFGTYYPWFSGSCALDDGTLLTIMTEERKDKSADEAIVFTIKGF